MLADARAPVPRYLADGLHPNDLGMRELATNLNAQMGFSAVQYKVIKCPPLTLAVSGLGPDGWFDVYWGMPAEQAHLLSEEAGGGPTSGRRSDTTTVSRWIRTTI